MTNTICGHDRDTLIWALTDPDPLNNAEREKRVIVPIGGPIDCSQCVATPKQRAAACVLDPAKLAEMLAHEGRRRGLGADAWVSHNKLVGVQISTNTPILLYMAEARALLLQWLQLPEGARDEALRVLRGEPLRDPRVDWSNDLRPGVLGGECARCLHIPPLHEPGCVLLECVAPNPCACRRCQFVRPDPDELLNTIPLRPRADEKRFDADPDRERK